MQPAYALLSPLMVQLTACAITEPPTVIAPNHIRPGSIYALQILATPDALCSDTKRHIFDGQFHLPLLPLLTSCATTRTVEMLPVNNMTKTCDARKTAARKR